MIQLLSLPFSFPFSHIHVCSKLPNPISHGFICPLSVSPQVANGIFTWNHCNTPSLTIPYHTIPTKGCRDVPYCRCTVSKSPNDYPLLPWSLLSQARVSMVNLTAMTPMRVPGLLTECSVDVTLNWFGLFNWWGILSVCFCLWTKPRNFCSWHPQTRRYATYSCHWKPQTCCRSSRHGLLRYSMNVREK